VSASVPCPVDDAGEPEVTLFDQERLVQTAPGEVLSVALSCAPGQSFVSGYCSHGQGATIVESARGGEGWVCGFTSTVDGTTGTVAVVCAVARGDGA
jgi:hypothetical protein